MSKFIYICHKRVKNCSADIKKICKNITPDNIEPNKPVIYSDNEGISFGVFNPNESNLIKDGSLALGYVNSKNWHIIGNDDIDGNFAIIRSSPLSIEILTDTLASRTIWYYQNEDFFIASTSQRMLISYLGSFSPNEKAISWMISSGTLGPENSWDIRLKSMPADSKIILNRESWNLSVHTNKIVFEPLEKNYSSNMQNLKRAINSSLKTLNIDLRKWALPISGGYDSRGILLNLEEKSNLQTITWGLKSSINEVGSDAYIARQISEKLNLNHKYYPTDFSNESVSVIFDRFLKIGEGRTDNIGGYLDGFSIWKVLFMDGFHGIIRGDEGFGWSPVKTESEARIKNGINYISDYDNLKPWLAELPSNELPHSFLREENESVETWRDRLYHQFRAPYVLAALSDLKLSHVEIINPLLSKEIIMVVRTLPDKLRTDKLIFKRIVDSYGLKIPYAKHGSNMEIKSIFKKDDVVDEIRQVIRNTKTVPESLVEYILLNIKNEQIENNSYSKKEKIVRNTKAILPVFIKDLIKRNIPMNLDVNVLGFRVYMIVKMHEILKIDADSLKD